MQMKETVHFTKMQGAGNDYIYVDTQQYDIPDKVEAQASNASIVANRRSTSHVIINQQAGKIIF